MVEHVVLFAVQPDTPPEQVALMGDRLRALQDKIPGVASISFGPTFTDRGKQFTHGLVVRLDGKDALEAYAEHPEHVQVLEENIKPIVNEVVALDWFV
ncbi:MAG: Dabb family protein [Planctomycetota bacterium]